MRLTINVRDLNFLLKNSDRILYKYGLAWTYSRRTDICRIVNVKWVLNEFTFKVPLKSRKLLKLIDDYYIIDRIDYVNQKLILTDLTNEIEVDITHAQDEHLLNCPNRRNFQKINKIPVKLLKHLEKGQYNISCDGRQYNFETDNYIINGVA